MANKIPGALVALWLAAIGCEPAPEGALPGSEAAAPAAAPIVRTGDPTARGFTEADFPRVKELGDGVYSYEQLRSAGDERFTTVSLFVVTSEGVLVADGQGSVAETERLLAAIAETTSRPVTHLVVCSDHGDHTGGNAAFPEGIRVWAHPTSAAALEARATARPSRPEAPGAPVPTDLVDDRAVVELGGRTIEILFLGRAHTGGDLVVHLPEEKILFMSEAYLNRIFPAMRSAYPTEWVDMIERAQAMDVDVYVPGHGFVEEPRVLEEELDTFRVAIDRVIAEARRLHELGLAVEEAVERAEFGALEGWSLRSSQGGTAIRRVYLELDGELR